VLAWRRKKTGNEPGEALVGAGASPGPSDGV